MSSPRNKSASSSPPAPKFWKTPRFRKTTRSLIKKSAPFLLTALAGYVEHKWHEQEEEEQKQQDDRELEKEKRKNREKEIERRASVESLRRQVDRLKRKIRRGDREGKGKQRERSSSESTESSELSTRSNEDGEAEVEKRKTKEIPRHHKRRTLARERDVGGERAQPRGEYFQRPAYREPLPSERYFSETTRITIKDEERRRPIWEQQRDDYFNRKRTTSSIRIPQQPIPPTVPTPPIIFPEPVPIILEREKRKISRRSLDQEQVQGRPIYRYHQRCSTGSRPTPGLSSEAMEHAGRVAALAGFIEAVHVGDTDGEWIGEKGVRVATAAAGSAAVGYGRERIFGDGAKEGGKDRKGGRRREGCLEDEIIRGSEVLGDVSAGLLASRLVLGSSHPRVEEDRRGRKRGRRWSYCY